MSFLQPFMLAALPLVALPIVIHLINQRRFQTIQWAAMMFLLAANRMSRGYARLRQWLIMAFRMLVVAGLIFAISRPLASGWLGVTAGGRADTTIIIFDRSPSMQQHGLSSASSKLQSGRQQIAQTLQTLSSARWVLIDSANNKPIELESPESLLQMANTEAASSSADIPSMLEVARDYLLANQSGRTEVWICSDVRQNDWNDDAGRWKPIRDSFIGLPQSVRFHLLAYPQLAKNNIAVRVTDVRRVEASDGAELLVSLRLTRDSDREATVGLSGTEGKKGEPLSNVTNRDSRDSESERTELPIQFEIDGARSEHRVVMSGTKFDLKEHRIPLDRNKERGWGKVSIPADGNPADNDFYFVFDRPVERHTVIVADDPVSVRSLFLASEIAFDPSVKGTAEILGRDQLSNIEWDSLSLLIWQSRLPDDSEAGVINAFVERGGRVVFLPPTQPDEATFAGVHWKAWQESQADVAVETWRGDQDLLANTQSGVALPVGQVLIRRFAAPVGEFTTLASLRGGVPLLARAPTNRGGIYFCGTTMLASDSSFASNGVVLYVMVQRALAEGASNLGNTRSLAAGDSSNLGATWQKLIGEEGAISTNFTHHRGVYRSGERLVAVNRAPAEDDAPVLSAEKVNGLFEGLQFSRVDDRAGSFDTLVQEIWRTFLVMMMVSMIVEAALCLPKVVVPTASGGVA